VSFERKCGPTITIGTIEGRLEIIQEGHGGALQFQIRDAMLRQKVRCSFPEELLPEVIDRFRKRLKCPRHSLSQERNAGHRIVAERIEALPR